ncbi:MAG: hypothetical protein KF748_09725 [Xanthobacteraceae bacterium]|nr:hypothetical protein [Xanthobacteraceae bacterium]
MKRLVPALALIAWLMPAAAARAAPAAAVAAPEAISRNVKVSRVCHHYRWSSQRRCTSAKTLRFVTRPPLFYPQRYFGGTPHYAQRFYWRPDDHYYYGWPYWRYRYYASPWR